MPHYMYRWAFKDTTTRSLTETPVDREPHARQVIEAFGGKMLSYYFMLGEYDGFGVAEFPDTASAAACSMRITSSGSFAKFETHALLTTAEAKAAMQKVKDTKVDYRAPGG